MPRCHVPLSISHSDYCEPPVELSPDEDHQPFPFPKRRAQGRCHTIMKPPSGHNGMYIYSDRNSKPDSFNWVSPMQLRKYFRSDSSPKERRGLFSSPFVKRKGSDNTYARVIPPEERHLLRTASFETANGTGPLFGRMDSSNSIGSNSTSESHDQDSHSRRGSIKSAQPRIETVVIATNVVESPVDVHQVDDNTLTKDKPPGDNMEAVANCFDDILKNCDDVTMERKCACKTQTSTRENMTNITNKSERENVHNKSQNIVTCKKCNCPKSQKEDSNRNSIHNSSDCSGTPVQSPDDKTLTKGNSQPGNIPTTTIEVQGSGNTPKIESFLPTKNIDGDVKQQSPACDSPDLGVDDTSPTGKPMFIHIVGCQRGGVSNKPPWLQAATRHRPGIL